MYLGLYLVGAAPSHREHVERHFILLVFKSDSSEYISTLPNLTYVN